jgi:hypothetical protein
MKLVLAFKALLEGAGLALGCGVSPGAFFLYYYRENASHSALICPEKQFFVNILCRQSPSINGR